MLTTFVIALREGLEAALIVGIIAAFLRRNGASLRPMWFGVGLAIVLSLLVGLGLDIFEHALPQAGQEGMESAIGFLAVILVTGMIFWMNRHARGLKRELEAEAAQALGQASTLALASMAFLAVLKEGFETSVFLLATFSAAQLPLLAAGGALVGLLLAAAIGWGIFIGGIKLNLSRFFRITGAFLILVAAGLVVTSLRSAHEAGWLLAGQQPTMNLAWLVAPGTVQSALVTGVLGIPANPRRIELLGWLAYLVPVALLVYWPQAWRPAPRLARTLRLGVAGVLVIVALALATAYPRTGSDLPLAVPLVGAQGQALGTATLDGRVADGTGALTIALDTAEPTHIGLPRDASRVEQRNGLDAAVWTLPLPDNSTHPATLTLDQVITLAGGRVPVGLNARQHPGPFNAAWAANGAAEIAVVNGVLLDVSAHGSSVVTLSGGGLATQRTIRAAGDPAGSWQADPSYLAAAVDALSASGSAAAERQFWAVELPAGLLVLALLIAVMAGRGAGPVQPQSLPPSGGRKVTSVPPKGVPYAAQ